MSGETSLHLPISVADHEPFFAIAYAQAHKIGIFPENIPVGLSNFHELHDPLLSYINLGVMGIGRPKEQPPSFQLKTDLMLSPSRIAKPDHGYYGYNRIQSIRTILARSGYLSDFTQDRYYQNSLMVPLEATGTEAHVHFGYESRAHQKSSIKNLIKQSISDGRGEADSVKDRRNQLREGLTNQDINIYLFREKPASFDLFPILKDNPHFRFVLDPFIKFVGTFTAALYQEQGLIVPTQPVVLTPFSRPEEIAQLVTMVRQKISA